MSQNSRTDIAIVIPAYNAAAFLRTSYETFARLRNTARVVVVDAGSSDETRAVALGFSDHVESCATREGPAAARNRGAAIATQTILLFVDADCVPHADAVEKVLEAFGRDPDLVSLTGSYDDDPPEQNFASLYMNLRHHYTHQHARREPGTFWAGCGAVRRSAFLDVGGFDATRYPRPAIEDIELATRLQARGRTLLDPSLQVTHLKRWTLRSVVETDIFHRGIPWAKLVNETGSLPDDLNMRRSQRVAVAVAPLAIASLVLMPFSVAEAMWGLVSFEVVLIAGSAATSGGLLRFFAARKGIPFALAAWLFHQFHLTYSAVVFVSTLLWCRLHRGRRTTP